MWTMVCITWTAVFVSDLSGVTDELAEWVERTLRLRRPPSLKPLSCPLCLTWWTLLVWMAATGNLDWRHTALAAALAAMADVMALAARTALRVLRKMMEVANEKLE